MAWGRCLVPISALSVLHAVVEEDAELAPERAVPQRRPLLLPREVPIRQCHPFPRQQDAAQHLLSEAMRLRMPLSQVEEQPQQEAVGSPRQPETRVVSPQRSNLRSRFSSLMQSSRP